MYLEEEALLCVWNEELGVFEKYEEPFAVVEYSTEKDFENMMAAVEHYKKRGEWVYTGRGNSWECTHCNSCLDMSDDENGHARYCPQCGANMRGGASDE